MPVDPKTSVDRHIWMEASAGTGKTYSLVQIVLQIIASGQASIEEIALVTFTEKATGELEERIYGALTKESANNLHCQKAITNFEQAEIHTIHSFCHRMLLEYNFQTKTAFRPALIDDEILLDQILADTLFSLQGDDWKERLQKSGFPGYNGFFQESRWLKSCRRLALSYQPRFAALSPLLTEPGQTDFTLMAELIHKLQENLYLHKKNACLISYEDMLADFHRSLQESLALKASIRQRFPFVIVDEFQDTDQLQWHIFRDLFLVPESRLIVVGDRKQSIYGFRGADIEAYNQCQQEFLHLKEQGLAETRTLDTSYRSRPELITALNALFAHPQWFGSAYQNIQAAQENHNYLPLPGQSLKGAPVQAVDLRAEKTAGRARLTYHRFLAREIQDLLAEGFAFSARQKTARPLHYGDIAILVRRSADALSVERELRRAGIPYSYYKKPGLFASREASEFEFLLGSLANPRDQSLRKLLCLTSFVSLQEPEAHPSTPDIESRAPEPDTVSQDLINKWESLAWNADWPNFFHSVLFESGALRVGGMDADRHRENLMQIAEELEKRALTLQHSVASLLTELLRLRERDDQADENATLHRRETQAERVQIMTIHAAKGLEFPVVFLAGGLTGNQAHMQSYLSYHDPDTGQKIFTLPVSAADKTPASEREGELWKKEMESEDRRLFYVACTRAAFRLYLPYFSGGRPPGFMAKMGHEALANLLGCGLADLREPTVEKKKNTKPSASKTSKPGAAGTGTATQKKDDTLTKKLDATRLGLTHRSMELLSFSRLMRRHQTLTYDVGIEKTVELAVEENLTVPGPEEESTTAASDDLILRGKEVGNFFHEILEKLDFPAFEESPWPAQAEALLLTHWRRYFPDADPALLAPARSILQRTIHTIPGQGQNSPLAALIAQPMWQLGQEMIREMEFCFSLDAQQRQDLEKNTGLRLPGGYVQGSIDLVFRHAGRFYLADWKTNTLSDYSEPALATVMQEHYLLQLRIYSCALVRWLKENLPDFSFEAHFGGCFYFFLRGLDPEVPGRGIFFQRPEAAEIEILFHDQAHV